MIVYNNQAPNKVNNVGQFGATEGSIGAYKQAAEYAADAKYWALLSQTKYNSVEDILAEVERLYAQGLLLEEDIKQLKIDFEAQQQDLLGLIQSTNTAIDNTNAATELSKEATQEVLAQLDIISNMTVQTTLLPPGSMATGSYDNSTGVFSFGIPEGQPGRDGTDGTISDIGNVPVGTPATDDYGFYVDKIDGGLYRADMSDIANLVPSVRSVSINGGAEQMGAVAFNSVSSFNSRTGDVVSQNGDYEVSQITGAASSGANSDITSLSGLTTALSVSQGGTGATTAEESRTNLGLGSVSVEDVVPLTKGGTGATTADAARTSLGLGLVSTESIVPITKGGTGSTSAENARLALVAAKSGDNSDITSMTNSVTFTQPVSVADAVDATNAVNLGQISSDQGASLIGTLEGVPVQNIISNINTDIIQLKLNWAIENGYSDAGFTFTTGGTLTVDDRDKVVYDPVSQTWYSYAGSLPVIVPAGFNPVGNANWKPQTDPNLRSELESSQGASLIGVSPSGNVQSGLDFINDGLYYVTPEQYGAIGDGVLHPLSEFFADLPSAQIVYPLATSLSQSIDWAAMQKADTVARSLKCGVRYPSQKVYYFSSLDTLMLDINSSHIGGPQSDHFYGTMIKKDKPAVTSSTNIGDICIVKVKKASDTASTNGFVNGVVFQGFSLEWANVAWETPLQGDLSICLHMNDAIKAKVDVSVWGGEFGVYGYGCWGMVGTIRVLSCHKGIYFDPVASTPEHPTSVGITGSTTSFDLRLEIGGTVFPIYLDKCQYSKFRGYIEVLEGTIWDSANETPVAIQLGSECIGLKFELGMEFWNGVYLLADKDNKDIVIDPEFIYTYTYNDASGPRTARHTIANKYAQTGVTIPASSRAIFAFNNTGNDIIVRNMYLSATATSFNNLESVDKYLYASLTGNRLFFDGGNVAPTDYLKVTRANKRVIDFTRNNGLADALRPGVGWYYVGAGMYEMFTWGQLTTDSTGAAWLNSPTGFNIQTVIAYPVGAGGLPHVMGITAVPTADTMRFVIDSGADRNIAYKMKAELIN